MRLLIALLAALLLCSTAGAATTSGGFDATLGNLQGNGCDGPSSAGFAQGAHVGGYWLTRSDYSANLTGAVVTGSPVGLGNTCRYRFRYASISSTQWCGDVVSWTYVDLGTISGATQTAFTFSIPLVFTGLTCSQIFVDLTGGVKVVIPKGGVFTAYWSGSMLFSKSGSGNSWSSGAGYIGNIDNTTNIDRNFWITPVALNTAALALAISTAPGSGVTRHVQLAYSSGPPSSSQSCADTTLTVLADSFTISGATQKSGSSAPAAVAIAAGSCIEIQVSSTGGTAALISNSAAGLEVTAADGNSYVSLGDAGSGGFDSSHTFGIGHWAISDINSNGDLVQQYWVAPPTGLSACAGTFTFASAVSGTGQFNIGITGSTAGPSNTQTATDLSYTSTTAGSAAAVGAKSLSFPMTAFAVPGYGLFGINITTSGGSPTIGSANFNWQMVCATGAPSVIGAGVTIGAGVAITQ